MTRVSWALGLAVAVSACAPPCRADLVISQYYEGSSGTNKWIELYNWGSVAIDLSTVRIGLWSNAGTEGYKTDVAPGASAALSGTLAAGAVYVIGNSAATPTPTYVVPNININGVANFNGDDSIALYTGATFDSDNIIDAIGFTDAGNEGTDISFVRATTAQGFSLTVSSKVTDFPSVWSSVSLATVNGASAGTTERIGFATITVVPEASGFAFAGLICSVVGLIIGSRKLWARQSA